MSRPPRYSADDTYAHLAWIGPAAVIGIVVFGIVTIMVQLGWFSHLDSRATAIFSLLPRPFMRFWVRAVDRYLTPPFALFFAIVLAMLLAAFRFGRWALTPFAFLVSFPIEAALKLIVQQHDADLVLRIPFGFTIEAGSFPSGHAIRGSFFCAYLAGLLWTRGDLISRLVALILIPVALLIGIARLAGDVHLLSDVIAGLALGAALGLLAVWPVARRLIKRESVRSPG